MNESVANEDLQLLQRIARQERQAFSLFYDRFAPVLYATAVRILRNPEEAALVLEEAFLQIWNQAGSYDAKWSSPFHWALGLTRHKAIARLKALRGRYSFVEELNQEISSPSSPRPAGDSEYPGRDQTTRIHGAVEELPLEHRQAIEMAFLGGMGVHEIADSLHQPAATIKARIRRGLLGLRDHLKGAA